MAVYLKRFDSKLIHPTAIITITQHETKRLSLLNYLCLDIRRLRSNSTYEEVLTETGIESEIRWNDLHSTQK